MDFRRLPKVFDFADNGNPLKFLNKRVTLLPNLLSIKRFEITQMFNAETGNKKNSTSPQWNIKPL